MLTIPEALAERIVQEVTDATDSNTFPDPEDQSVFSRKTPSTILLVIQVGPGEVSGLGMGDPSTQERFEEVQVEIQSRGRNGGDSGDLCRAAFESVQGSDLVINELVYWVYPVTPVTAVQVQDTQRRKSFAGRVHVTRRVT